MRRAFLVINRRARHLAFEGPYLAKLRGAARDLTVYETRSLSELDAVTLSIAKHGADAVILAGGDGAYMAGVTSLFHRMGEGMPALGLAPGGTVSTVARNWGTTGTMDSYGERLVRAVADGTATSTIRPSMRVEDDRGGDRIGFIWGAGLVARFFQEYYARSAQGYAAAAPIVARIFFGSYLGGDLARRVLSPVALSLDIDGVRQAASAYSLVAASVVRNLGLHMWLLHRAGEDVTRVHVVASALRAAQLGPQMPRVLRGLPLRGADHVDTLAGEVVVRFAKDDAYVLDGELLTAREVTVKAGPPLTVLSA